MQKETLERLAAKSALRREEAIILALQLMSWGKFSREHPRLVPAEKYLDASALNGFWEKLSALPGSGNTITAFSRRFRLFEHVAPHLLPDWMTFFDAGRQAAAVIDSVEELLLWTADNGVMVPPKELVDTIVEMASVTDSTSVYCPFDHTFQFSIAALRKGAHVVTESSHPAPLGPLAEILLGENLTVNASSPLSWGDRSEELVHAMHDVTIGVLPFGQLARGGGAKTPSHSGIRNIELAALRRITQVTRDRAVIAVAPRIAFGGGAEREFRQWLLEEGRIAAVTALPTGLFHSMAIGLNVITLSLSSRKDSVWMLDATQSPFTTIAKNKRPKISAPLELAACASGNPPCTAVAVPYADIQALEYSLEVRRYVNADGSRRRNVPATSKLVPLGTLVDFIQPLQSRRKAGDLLIYELGPSDIPEFGYVRSADKVVEIDRDSSPSFVQPGDIIFVVRGSVGKVGIVPEDIPPPGPGGWAIGQSGVILRVRDRQNLPPPVLFSYLRSSMAQELIERETTTGTTARMLQLAKLKNLPVILPTRESSDRILANWNEEVEIEARVQNLRRRQEQLAEADWPSEA